MPNIHGGAMWARMPKALSRGFPFEEWAELLWKKSSTLGLKTVLEEYAWMAKIDGKFYPGKYYFTVD